VVDCTLDGRERSGARSAGDQQGQRETSTTPEVTLIDAA
jgi:hypothetical protein